MAQITLDTGSASYAVKEVYSPERVKFLVHSKDQLLMRVRKEESWKGGQYVYPVEYGYGQGIAFQTYSKAYDNAGANAGVQFAFDQAKLFAVARLSNHAIINTGGDAGAFLNLLEAELDRRLASLGWVMSSALYRSVAGSLATVSSNDSGSPLKITLTNKGDAAAFEPGMKIVTAASVTAALDSATADTIASVDRAAGTITLTVNSGSQNGTYSANRLIFREGTYDTASEKQSICGLSSWFPTTAPTTTDIGGVNRSVDPVRLAGHRLDGSSGDLESLIQEMGYQIAREGGTANFCVMSPARMHQLQQDLQGRVEFSRASFGDASTGVVGFNNIVVMAGGGIECTSSWACPDDRIYVLALDSLKLCSAGPAPHLDESGGGVVKPDLVSTSSGVIVRAEAYCNLVCTAPGHNGVIHTLPSL